VPNPGAEVKETSLVGLREAVRGTRRGLNPLDALVELIDREPRGLTSFLAGLALDTKAGLDVRLSAPMLRPWNAPLNAMIPERSVE